MHILSYNTVLIVHILSPVTDNCSSWISGRGSMAVEFFHDQVCTKECAERGDRTRGRLHGKRTRFRSSYRPRLIWKQSRQYSFIVLTAKWQRRVYWSPQLHVQVIMTECRYFMHDSLHNKMFEFPSKLLRSCGQHPRTNGIKEHGSSFYKP